ncbi:hypothetical protein DID88_002979 [Monilinia fructigena]|uniref:Uncharacterized protein n=1 Tax=Monilinia fructigena TaxID=38457 RepID=A0A395IH66_9HELO|nr:hypothetical protein DID88_002979 [Monilinia fructigena]
MASAVAESRKTNVCPANDDTVVPAKRRKLAIEEKVQAEERKLRSPGKEIRNKQSWDYMWRTGLAGGLAGSAAKTVVAPLDRESKSSFKPAIPNSQSILPHGPAI